MIFAKKINFYAIAGAKSAKKVNDFLGKVRDKVTYCIKIPISV